MDRGRREAQEETARWKEIAEHRQREVEQHRHAALAQTQVPPPPHTCV